MIEQAVILCGGLGSRLGQLTQSTPKPLLPVAGRPFLEWLIREIVRQGARRILLLAAFEAGQVRDFAARASDLFRVPVQVIEEPERAGTGGALWNARDLLEESFFLMNGDSLFDVLLADLALRLDESSGVLGVLALREVNDASRFGVVELDGGFVASFSARPVHGGAGLVNGGVYALRKEIVAHLSSHCSLEADVLPQLASAGRLMGLRTRDYFIDIGVPESYALAQTQVPAKLTRPAVFFDRDGVLNIDHGHVGSKDQFEWQQGAREAVRAVNAAGYLVFIVTNQAGIAKDFYSEADFNELMSHMRTELFALGAHIDDLRYCPHHPDATVEKWRKDCGWRKPSPGMLLDLLRNWPIDTAASFVIGDKKSDLIAAEQAGLKGLLFPGGDLLEFLQQHIPLRRKTGHDIRS